MSETKPLTTSERVLASDIEEGLGTAYIKLGEARDRIANVNAVSRAGTEAATVSYLDSLVNDLATVRTWITDLHNDATRLHRLYRNRPLPGLNRVCRIHGVWALKDSAVCPRCLALAIEEAKRNEVEE